MKYSPTDIARQYLFVREAKEQNTGLRVEAIQKWCGGEKGLSWCCYFVTMVLDICFQGESPIPRTGSCQEVYDLAKKNGWVVRGTPAKNYLFLYVDANDHAHHIGIVTDTSGEGAVSGIAGNTSTDGKSSNGKGVYEHEIHATVFIAFPRA